MKAARIFLGLFVICAAALGLLVVFEVVDSEKVVKYGMMATGGLFLLAVTSAVLGAVGGHPKVTPTPMTVGTDHKIDLRPRRK